MKYGEQIITAKMIMKWNPCEDYTPERIKELSGDGKTAFEICDNKVIPIEDTQWVLHYFLPEPEVHELACKYAERALRRARKDGCELKESWELLRIKRLWIRGEVTDTELDNARIAANWAATWVAHWAADWVAGRVADRAVNWAADWAADWVKERKEQLKLIRKVLNKEIKHD